MILYLIHRGDSLSIRRTYGELVYYTASYKGDGALCYKTWFGYTVFEHISHGIAQEMTQFVPVEDSVKISILKLRNETKQHRRLTLTYYVRPVLGVSDQLTATQISTEVNEQGAIIIRNNYNDEFPGRIAFVDASVKDRSITCDRREFFGIGVLKIRRQ